MNDCDCAKDCCNCKFEKLSAMAKPCYDCTPRNSEFICKACEDEKIKQARFEKYLDEKEELRK